MARNSSNPCSAEPNAGFALSGAQNPPLTPHASGDHVGKRQLQASTAHIKQPDVCCFQTLPASCILHPQASKQASNHKQTSWSKGGVAPLSANPAFGPAERNGGATSCSPRAPDCWERGPGCWEIAPKFWKNCSEILDLGLGIWTFNKQSGAWTSNLGLGTDCRELSLRCGLD